MKRCAAGMVAAIQQCGISVQKFAHAADVAGFRSGVNLMILPRFRLRGSATAIASSLQQRGNGLVSAFSCHFNQAEAVMAVPLCIRTGIEKHLHNLSVALTYCEMNGGRIEISLSTQ